MLVYADKGRSERYFHPIEPEASLSGTDVAALPPEPATLSAVGISPAVLNGLVLRHLYRADQQTSSGLARRIGMSALMLTPLLHTLRLAGLLEARAAIDGASRSVSADDSASERVWLLSASGRRHAAESFLRSRYVGPAPVPLEQYRQWMVRQRASEQPVQPLRLSRRLATTALTAAQLHGLARALSRRGIVYLHGPSGSGKSHLLARLQEAIEGTVAMPHAVLVDEHIVEVFDRNWHQPIAPSIGLAQPTDGRWLLVRRPVIRVGAELSPSMLALRREPGLSRIHAPFQIKAGGGFLLVDDFARHPAMARALISRWLGPVERGHEWLGLPGGLCFEIPFTCRLVIAASVAPCAIGDAALLRRLSCALELRASS